MRTTRPRRLSRTIRRPWTQKGARRNMGGQVSRRASSREPSPARRLRLQGKVTAAQSRSNISRRRDGVKEARSGPARFPVVRCAVPYRRSYHVEARTRFRLAGGRRCTSDGRPTASVSRCTNVGGVPVERDQRITSAIAGRRGQCWVGRATAGALGSDERDPRGELRLGRRAPSQGWRLRAEFDNLADGTARWTTRSQHGARTG